MKKKYFIFSMIIFVILLLAVSDCSPVFTSKIYHDKFNPCSKGEFQDLKECNEWKKNYPKEYERYKKRLQKINQ